MAREIGSPDFSTTQQSYSFAETASVNELMIGNSVYHFPSETKKFFEPVAVASTYEHSRSVLILTEPHESIGGQFGVFRFLESFFKENPSLISKTIFLAEGVPANEPLSVRELVKVAPKPTDELIWETLNTLLITGYIAYAWKHHQENIPIIGTEDPILYGLSARLPKHIKMESTPESSLITTLAVVSRNKSMAETLIGQTRIYENPILFAGVGHIITSLLDQEQIKAINPGNLAKILSKEELIHIHGIKNMRIHDYLELEIIGYTCFSHLQASSEASSILENERYRRLFSTQQGGDYDGYINWYLAQKLGRTTISPSPDAAAQFLKKYLDSKPNNQRSAESVEKGAASASESKFTEAAQEFSDAGSIEPNFPGYTVSVQESLFKDIRWKLLQVYGGKTEEEAKSLKYTREAIPIFGPRMRKDHPQRVSHFAKRFSGIQGVQEVINNAMSNTWLARLGSQLQLDAAEIIGPERIRAFEEKHRLSGGINRIDIATKENIAIECKNFKITSVKDVKGWLKQTVRRFETSITYHSYAATVVVIPEKVKDKEFKQIEQTFKFYRERLAPEFSDRIWLCRLTDLQNTLNKIRK